jgi:hypothetical protein
MKWMGWDGMGWCNLPFPFMLFDNIEGKGDGNGHTDTDGIGEEDEKE